MKKEFINIVVLIMVQLSLLFTVGDNGYHVSLFVYGEKVWWMDEVLISHRKTSVVH